MSNFAINFREVQADLLKPGTLFRTATIAHLPQESLRNIYDYGVRVFIDLRSMLEISNELKSKLEIVGIEYTNIPFYNDDILRQIRSPQWLDYGKAYLRWIDVAEGVPAVLKALVSSKPGGCLIGCLAGKDRTGVTCAVISGLMGIDDQNILDCYHKSHVELMHNIDFFSSHWIKRDQTRTAYAARFSCERRSMLYVLEYVRQKYGSWENYACDKGITPREISLIINRFKRRGI